MSEGSCYHTKKDTESRQARTERAMVGLRAMSLTHEMLPFAAQDPEIKSRAWTRIAAFLSQNPDILTRSDAKAFYIEGAVDNFLDHSYGNAMGMYWLFLLARAAEKCPSVPHFLQCILAYVPESDPDLGKIKTPWGTPYVGWPPSFKEADVVRIAEQLLKDTTEASSGEDALLCMLLREPLVACECLRTEDPYDERFGKKPAQGTGKLRKKPHAYMMDCAKCYTMPQGGESFPLCKRCRRVRYCGVECQRADWPRHKVECGKKRADWWGRAPLASRKQLQEQGLM